MSGHGCCLARRSIRRGQLAAGAACSVPTPARSARARGFCGLREVRQGRLRHLAGTPDRGLLHWCRDPLPTNCVADPSCAGHSQRGKHNLAVFYASCTADCLCCQNRHFQETDPLSSAHISAEELVGEASLRTHCVCFFGGDPVSQMPHALAASRHFASRGLMDRAMDVSLASGGCVKFDLKAHDEYLHRAVTGVGNERILEYFARAASRFEERTAPPPVVASTLLVPGYIDAEEVGRIARFIADLNPEIPCVLQGFGPSFLLPDLPRMSVHHADEAAAAARAAGLRTVHVGNRHLLSCEYWVEPPNGLRMGLPVVWKCIGPPLLAICPIWNWPSCRRIEQPGMVCWRHSGGRMALEGGETCER